MERLISTAAAALLVCGMAFAEERPGEAGLTFKLRQERLTPGPQKTPDGQLTVRYTGLTAHVIETATGKAISPPLEHKALRKDSRITAFAFSPDGKLLAVGTGDPRGKAMGDSAGEVRVWDVATGKLVASINPAKGDIGYVQALAFSGDGKTVLVDCLELSGK